MNSGGGVKAIMVSAFLCLVATCARAAGIGVIEIPADANGPALKAMIWTPCAVAAQDVTVGPYVLMGQRDCPTVGDRLPLILISHGHGGSFLGHHDLAERLADAGYVVAAINHPGDTFSDLSRQAELSEFIERPTDIERAVDYMIEKSPEAAKIDRERIGFFGFSRGGYTGIVLAGGNPDFLNAKVACPDPTLPICESIRRKEVPSAPLAHDARIRAFVLADPLNEFPTAADLKDIRAPIQLWASEFGGDGVLPDQVRELAEALPQKPEFHLVAGAAHFAFLAPCSPKLAKDAPQICVDERGFDRIGFHRELCDQALAFFNAKLR